MAVAEAARRSIAVPRWHAFHQGERVFFSARPLDAARIAPLQHELGDATLKIGDRQLTARLLHADKAFDLAKGIEADDAVFALEAKGALAVIGALGASISEGVAIELAGGE